MRADEDGFAGAGAGGALVGDDFGVDVGDDGREGCCEAVVELGDGLAAGGGDHVGLLLGSVWEDGWEVGFEGGGRRWRRVVEEGGWSEPFSVYILMY